jgi:hypothetical protein
LARVISICHRGTLFSLLFRHRLLTSKTSTLWNETIGFSTRLTSLRPSFHTCSWKNEFATFSNFAVAVYSGDKRFRDMELEKLRDGRAEVLIVAKSMFQSRSSFQPLDTIRWKLVVIDEFHTFKVRYW